MHSLAKQQIKEFFLLNMVFNDIRPLTYRFFLFGIWKRAVGYRMINVNMILEPILK